MTPKPWLWLFPHSHCQQLDSMFYHWSSFFPVKIVPRNRMEFSFSGKTRPDVKHTNAFRSKIPSSTGCVQSMLYLITLAFFFAPVFPPFCVLLVLFFVTLVELFASEDVDFALGVVALGLVWAGVVDDVAVAAAGFLVKSTFYRMEKRRNC